jgi:hypothetical protein
MTQKSASKIHVGVVGVGNWARQNILAIDKGRGGCAGKRRDFLIDGLTKGWLPGYFLMI